jgi:septum formation protein
LKTLRGKAHFLNSAVCLVRDGDLLWSEMSRACMQVRDFSDAFLDDYLERNGDAVLSSVGCYQLEGEGIQLFDAIAGDYFTILGLPLLPLLAALRDYGINHA